MTRRGAATLLSGGVLGLCLPYGVSGAVVSLSPRGSARHEEIASRARDAAPRVTAIRHDIHEHPELSNREVRTAGLVAARLRALGFDSVRTNVAVTGVVAMLKGAGPGPVVALRADMDALPVTEAAGLPYASKVRAEYQGQDVGVAHACGHDAHVAILLGVAEVLAAMRGALAGSVMFVFQPAEEGPPGDERGGAKLMLDEGAFAPVRPVAVFGLHVRPGVLGRIYYRPGGMMAAADIVDIKVTGRQTHAAMPWLGVDPIVVGAEIVTTLQTAVSRELNLMQSPVVISIGSIHGGLRNNIIPDSVTLSGTLRTMDPQVRAAAMAMIRRRVELTAAASGAKATVDFREYIPPVINPPALLDAILPSLTWAAGQSGTEPTLATMAADDFAEFQAVTPGVYFNLGVTPAGTALADAAPNHSPRFLVDDGALIVGVRALAAVAVDYLASLARPQAGASR